jgi:hypothetical protein
MMYNREAATLRFVTAATEVPTATTTEPPPLQAMLTDGMTADIAVNAASSVLPDAPPSIDGSNTPTSTSRKGMEKVRIYVCPTSAQRFL